jgi:hypothetical protein
LVSRATGYLQRYKLQSSQLAIVCSSLFNASLIVDRLTPFSVCTLCTSNFELARSAFKSTLPTIWPLIMNGKT